MHRCAQDSGNYSDEYDDKFRLIGMRLQAGEDDEPEVEFCLLKYNNKPTLLRDRLSDKGFKITNTKQINETFKKEEDHKNLPERTR